MKSDGAADQPRIETSGLIHLFDAEVAYVQGMAAVVSAEGRIGTLIGSGEGKVRGDQLRGAIRWSFYARNCAFEQIVAGFQIPEGASYCDVQPGGVILTHDAARIGFNAAGFGVRGYDPATPHLWRLTMAVQFATENPRYDWLARTPATLVSDFNEQTNRGLWRVFGVADPQSPRSGGD